MINYSIYYLFIVKVNWPPEALDSVATILRHLSLTRIDHIRAEIVCLPAGVRATGQDTACLKMTGKELHTSYDLVKKTIPQEKNT